MYLSTLKLWNFRKFGSTNDLIIDKTLRTPDLEVKFTKGLNVLIGENDSGKTAIIDAIKVILKTHSFEWIRLEQEDFYSSTKNLRIECLFEELEPNEAKNFSEWLTIFDEEEEILDKPSLEVILNARRNEERIFPFDIKAGADDIGHSLTAEAKEYLQTTYLKPLRDAKGELVPRKNSRLSQILQGHNVFKGKNQTHELVGIFKEFSDKVTDYFKKDGEKDGKAVTERIDDFLKDFFGEIKNARFSVTEQKLKNILETLRLTLEDGQLGLGSHNLLFIASELLNLERTDWDGIRLGLVEELEAHLHPQAQLRIITALQELQGNNIQFILTTHSPNLGSKIDLKSLIICEKESNNVFSMGADYTKLKEQDYRFLERFLDTTKANLFFAKGVILVEGWAEELLLPALAQKIGINLTEKGISIVNVGSTAFLRFVKIFQRNKNPQMILPVSVITDVDIKPDKYKETDADGKTEEDFDLVEEIEKKKTSFDGTIEEGFPIKTEVSPFWTLEYCIALSGNLQKLFYRSVLMAIKEEKDYTREKEIKIMDAVIAKEDYFNNWADESLDIAYNVYTQIIGKAAISITVDVEGVTETFTRASKGISKAIIAQCFAQLLEDDTTLSKETLLADSKIKYITDAIRYATRED